MVYWLRCPGCLIFGLLMAMSTGLGAIQPMALPWFFITNQGQFSPEIRYSLQAGGWRANFSGQGVTWVSPDSSLRMELVDASPDLKWEGRSRLPGVANFYYGADARKWRHNVAIWASLTARQLYPGIDLTYSVSEHRLKSEFLVRAGANPGLIRLRYRGARHTAVDANGNLVLETGGATLREQRPVAWQIVDGKKIQVDAAFALRGEEVEFQLGRYDPQADLVIDPVLSYGTYLGGSAFTAATGVAVDNYGDAFITGWTETRDIPATGVLSQTNPGGVDAFVAKLAPAGNSLVYVTYLGGSLEDRAFAIAATATGDAVITGLTYSTDWPVSGAVQAQLNGYENAFVARLNASGSLVFSTYLGGSGSDCGNAIALDSLGSAYVAGSASSTNFPMRSPFQSTNRGGQDAFVSKLSAAGALLYSTYLGGSGNDHANGIAVDAQGQAVVTGGTFSTDFPVVGALQSSNHGGEDAFVTRLYAGGNGLSFSTYLGGSGGTAVDEEQATAVALDASGNVYVAGVTPSTDFPLLSAVQSYGGGMSDAFAAKIVSNGAALAYSTYLGGGDIDWATGIGVDSSNRAWIGGYTASMGFPVVLPIQAQLKGDYDGFLTNLDVNGQFLFSSYLGGSKSDSVAAIAVDAAGSVYAAGLTQSTDLSLLNPVQTFNYSGYSALIAKLSQCTYTLSQTAISVSSGGSSGAITVSALNGCGFAASSNVGWATLTVSGNIVNWSVAANTGSQRIGTLTIAGQFVSVTQAAPPPPPPPANPPTVSVNLTSLNYGTNTALITSPQKVTINFSGPGNTSWSVSSNRANITVSPASGTGSGVFSITAAPGASGAVTLSAPGATNPQIQIAVNIANVTPAIPWGSFDTPINNSTGVTGNIPVTGWALDNIEVKKVDIWREPIGAEPKGSLIYIGDAIFIPFVRPDVQNAYPNAPLNYRAGWGYMMLTNFLPNNGNGTFKLHAIAHDAAGKSLDLGTRTITCDNAHATTPFGTIDTPSQGETVSGTEVNYGWALTQPPHSIPLDGSTILVFIDNQVVGHPVYNLYRSDIATLFPGYVNSNGAVGYFTIDTHTLANGMHSMFWTVTDEAGRVAGIGSRYFFVNN